VIRIERRSILKDVALVGEIPEVIIHPDTTSHSGFRYRLT
tara:strand:- start:238 stop:357 length:120 start_codon:yes stop_codon:yes gene_type:complete